MQDEEKASQPESVRETPRQRLKNNDWTHQEWFLTWLRLARRADQNPDESKNN